jgi:hypothetical protein
MQVQDVLAILDEYFCEAYTPDPNTMQDKPCKLRQDGMIFEMYVSQRTLARDSVDDAAVQPTTMVYLIRVSGTNISKVEAQQA